MPQQLAVLRVFVDGRWTADEIADLFKSLDEVYSDLALIDLISKLERAKPRYPGNSIAVNYRLAELAKAIQDEADDASSKLIQAGRFEVEAELGIDAPWPLEATKLRYGSEGTFDFLGDLNPLNNLKDLIIGLVGTPEQRAAAAVKKQEAKEIGIKNAEAAAESMRRQGVPDHIVQATYTKAMRKLGFKIPKYIEEKKMPRLPEIAPPPVVPRLPPPKSAG